MSDVIELKKGDAGFNEMTFVIQAADRKNNTNRPILEKVCFNMELPEVEGRLTAATDGARLHIVRGLGNVIEAKPGFYAVEKFTKALIRLAWSHDEVHGEFGRVHTVMSPKVEGVELERMKSVAVCYVIRSMQRNFSLAKLAEAMGYQAGFRPNLFVESAVKMKGRDGDIYHPVAKFIGDNWESYIMPLWEG